MKVWITGSSGYIGTQLLTEIERDRTIRAVVGQDVKPPARPFKKLVHHTLDVNAPELRDVILRERPEALVHLAFILNPIHDRALMRRVNVEGTRRIFEIAEAAGVKRVVMASSATAYGAFPDNPSSLTEEMPVRGRANAFQYAAEKAEIDELARDFARAHPKVSVNVLRPCIVIGPNISNFIARLLLMEPPVVVRGYDPPMQYVHETDAARAFWAVLKRGKGGAYNVAGPGTIRVQEAAAMTGRAPLEVPYWIASAVNGLLWAVHAKKAEAPAAVLDFMRYPWVVANGRLERDTKFRYRYTTREAFVEFLKARGRLGVPQGT